MSQSNDEGAGGPGDDGIAFAGIQNPSDALGILAQVADHDTQDPRMRGDPPLHPHQSHLALDSPRPHPTPPSFHNLSNPAFLPLPQPDPVPYQLCHDGVLTSWKIRELIARYGCHLLMRQVTGGLPIPGVLNDSLPDLTFPKDTRQDIIHTFPLSLPEYLTPMLLQTLLCVNNIY